MGIKQIKHVLLVIALVPILGFAWQAFVKRSDPLLFEAMNSLSFLFIIGAAIAVAGHRDWLGLVLAALHPTAFALTRVVYDTPFTDDFAFWVATVLFLAIVVLVVLKRTRPGWWQGTVHDDDRHVS